MSTSLSAAAPPFRKRDRLVPPDRRRRRSLSNEGVLSLVLHAAAIAVLLFGIARRHMNDVSPSAEVAVVFDGGPLASTPQTQDSLHSAPTAEPDVHATEPSPPGQRASRPSQAAPPPAAAQQREQQAEPPLPQTTPGASATSPAPRLESGAAPVQLRPTTAVKPPGAPSHPATRPATRAPARQSAANPFASLSAPMDLSLAGHAPPPQSRGRLARGVDMTMAPTDENRNIMTRYAEARHKLGEDWWGAFSQYVEDHKYYPLQAAKRGEDGQSVLYLVIERDGTVRSVKVQISSGSPELDSAWISEFRGQKVPAFPPGTTENEISFPASMTYILERQ